MKKIASIITIAALASLSAFAQFTVGSGTPVTTTYTNSSNGIIPTQPITIPTIYESIQFTNAAQIVTNYICFASTAGQTNPVILSTYVFKAADWGLTNGTPASPVTWTTNYPSQTVVMTNYIFMQARPQSGGATPTIQAH